MKNYDVDIQIAKLDIDKSQYDLDVFHFNEYVKNKNALLTKTVDMYESIQKQAKEYNKTIKRIKSFSKGKTADKTASLIVKKLEKQNHFLLNELETTLKAGENALELLSQIKQRDFFEEINFEEIALISAKRFMKNPGYETEYLLTQKDNAQN